MHCIRTGLFICRLRDRKLKMKGHLHFDTSKLPQPIKATSGFHNTKETFFDGPPAAGALFIYFHFFLWGGGPCSIFVKGPYNRKETIN